MERPIEVRILGPTEVWLGDRKVELAGRNERALIAYLALNANRPVSTDAIVDALWGEAAPPTAREMVRTYVARVRRRLGHELQRTGGGYMLEIPPDAVDAALFTHLVDEGLLQWRSGDHEASAKTLRKALNLWRGPPLEELELAGSRAEAAHFEELRLAAVEAETEAELSLGHAAELVPELAFLVQEYPYRERLRANLILALYRTGRQAAALEQYLEVRRLLVEEVGVEPSRELQELQAAILRQDPALDPPPAPSPPPASSSHTPTPSLDETEVQTTPRPIRRRVGVVAGFAVFATAAVGIFWAASSGRQSSTGVLRRHSIGAIDPVSGLVTQARRLGGEPGPIAVGRKTAWVGDRARDTIVGMSRTTLRVRTSVSLHTFPHQLATDGTRVWVGNGFDGTLSRVGSSDQTTAPFQPDPRSFGRLALAYGAGRVWVGSQDGSLSAVNPLDDRTTAVARGIGKPEALVVGGGAVWIAEADADVVLRVRVTQLRARMRIPIGGSATDLAIADGSVWAVTPGAGILWRIDVQTGAVTASVDVGPGFSLVASAAGQVWVASPGGTVERVDPRRNAVVRTLDLVGPIGGLSGGGRRLWISLR